MPVQNRGGALVTEEWNLTTDEFHLTSSGTINNGATITITPGATPNPIRFDGSFIITSTASGSGILTGTGTAASPIRWQPNGAATTWYEDNTNRGVFSDGTGGWTLVYHDFIGCGLGVYPSAGTNTITNIRVRVGRFLANGAALYFAPTGGTNTITDLECYGCHSTVFGGASVSGGTNVVRRIFIDGGTTGMALSITGGTNTFSDFKISRCVTPITFAGTAAISITNLVLLDNQAAIATSPGATSTITRLIVAGTPSDTLSHDVFAAAPGLGVVLTFDEAYVNMEGVHGFRNTGAGGTEARLVLSNSVCGGYRIPAVSSRLGIVRGTSSGNDFAFPSHVDGVDSAVDQGTSNNDYIASTGGMSGPVPFGVEVMQDWASANWVSVVDTDSGNLTSTSTPAQYGVIALTANRTNARATPNKPLTVSSISSGTPDSESATITFTTGIKARSRILIGTSAGVTRANATMVSPWKYHGILDPELVDFTLPVTSHSHALVNLKAGTTYYYVVECYDPCGRRFLGAEASFATTAAAGYEPTAGNRIRASIRG